MKALWISDAHLSDPDAPCYTDLMNLLRDSLEQVDELVILGDFFELWLGDNRVIIARHKPLLDIFREYRNRGKSISYLKGNHDFILGKTWEKDIGARIFDEEAFFPWDGYRFFASHGENIYKKDYGYQVIRKILRTPLTEKAIRCLDDEAVVRLSTRFASVSKGRPNKEKEEEQNRLFYQYAKSKLENNFHAAILGHTHVIQWHVIPVDGQPCLYANPGSWSDQKTFLWYENGRFQVRKYVSGQDAKILFDFIFPVE
jgi:UDP-2,3-diacylglucosamine hydrolase